MGMPPRRSPIISSYRSPQNPLLWRHPKGYPITHTPFPNRTMSPEGATRSLWLRLHSSLRASVESRFWINHVNWRIAAAELSMYLVSGRLRTISFVHHFRQLGLIPYSFVPHFSFDLSLSDFDCKLANLIRIRARFEGPRCRMLCHLNIFPAIRSQSIPQRPTTATAARMPMNPRTKLAFFGDDDDDLVTLQVPPP